MHDSSQHIALVVPGLCGGAAENRFTELLDARLPALERLLSRSRRKVFEVEGFDASLCAYFDLPCATGEAAPAAALTSLVDNAEPQSGYVLRADPVHLRADQSSLRLFDSRTFTITQDEADALVDAFNAFYANRGWTLVAPTPQRWYLHLPKIPVIRTTSPRACAGQAVDPNLPCGREAHDWHALMNEVQMLFHPHPVNLQREEGGQPAINSLWFWGEGRLPAPVPQPQMQLVSDDPLAMGLAHFTQTPRCDLPDSLGELLDAGGQARTLLVLDDLDAAAQYADPGAWTQSLVQMELHWFAPLLDALEDGRLNCVEIDTCNGVRYQTTRGLQKKFWKRVRPLAAICARD